MSPTTGASLNGGQLRGKYMCKQNNRLVISHFCAVDTLAYRKINIPSIAVKEKASLVPPVKYSQYVLVHMRIPIFAPICLVLSQRIHASI